MNHSLAPYWIILLLATLSPACKESVQTPEQFAEVVFRNVADANEKALFDNCYINSKSEIKKIALEFGGDKNATDEKVNEFYDAIMEDRQRILKKYSILNIYDFDAITIDSIVEQKETNRGFDPKLKISPGYRFSVFSIYLTNNDQKYLVKLACADLNTGSWKIVEHPRITKLN